MCVRALATRAFTGGCGFSLKKTKKTSFLSWLGKGGITLIYFAFCLNFVRFGNLKDENIEGTLHVFLIIVKTLNI